MTEEDKQRGAAYRRRFKERFFRILFGENRQKGRWVNRLRVRFQMTYPTVWNVLKQLKSRNYRHSSHVLQNFEATVFIYCICRRIMREQPRVFVLTVHDCLATTAEHKRYVCSVIADEFAKLGVRPKLSVEGHKFGV
jgi:hypothetical protein